MDLNGRRVLVTSDEAHPTEGQPSVGCSDCPWRRDAVAGWLGPLTANRWLEAAHGEERIMCHVLKGPQCAGAAIYRANVCKRPRDQSFLRLPADRTRVFAARNEFQGYHDDEEDTHR